MARKRPKSPPFLMVPRYLYRSEAWRSLDGNARSIFLELINRFNGHNNGMIGLSSREAGAVVNRQNDTGARALDMLLDRGFIAVASASTFNQKKLAREWRLTHLPDDRTGHKPSKEFMLWGMEKQKPVAQVRTIVAQVRSPTAKGNASGGNSRSGATVKPEANKAQSHPCDTSRYTIPPADGDGAVYTVKQARVPDLSTSARTLLRWLQGYGQNATHRKAQQNLSGRLTGDQITASAQALASADLIRIGEKGRSRIYILLDAGLDPSLTHDDDRQTDLVDWLAGSEP